VDISPVPSQQHLSGPANDGIPGITPDPRSRASSLHLTHCQNAATVVRVLAEFWAMVSRTPRTAARPLERAASHCRSRIIPVSSSTSA